MGPQRALSDFYSKPPLIQHHGRASSLEAAEPTILGSKPSRLPLSQICGHATMEVDASAGVGALPVHV